MNNSGVRYLTEDFIKITTKDERLDRIKKLNLSGSNNEKPIKYIENLDYLVNLNILILNFNIIEKIEKLDKLVNLKELYLSNNKLSKLDGIECLIKLKVLDVSGNKIRNFPYWLTRRCKYLKEINISNNEFDSMEEISKLGSLKDLINLNASENVVNSVSHYRPCTIVRLKFLQILDSRKVSTEERKDAIEIFGEGDVDKLTAKLVDKEKDFEQMKERQDKLEEEHARQVIYQKDLNKKQKDYIGRIKSLEEELKNKDSLLKKRSEDLFKTCQKYYELEQDLAFIKIDAKFDILNHNLGSLDAPDDVSEHSITGTGDHAYMGKGQFISLKEAQLLKQRWKSRQKEQLSNGHIDNGRDSSLEIKEQLVLSLQDRIMEKMAELDEVNKTITEQTVNLEELKKASTGSSISPTRGAIIGDFDRSRLALPTLSRFSPMIASLDRSKKLNRESGSPSSIADQFLEKVERLTNMQKEADELRKQMQSTERITNRQKEEVEYLRKEYEKMKLADPKLAHHIESEMHDKKSEVDENKRLYYALSNRLDQLSEAIEKAMEDIQVIERQLLEENQFFTDKMRKDIDHALQQLSKSIPKPGGNEQQKWMDAYRQIEIEKAHLERQSANQQENIEHLKLQLSGLTEASDRGRQTKRPIDREVLVLKQDLDRLKEDAIVAKEDLESEIEMEKVRNDELQKRLEEMQSNEYELQEQLELVSDRYRQVLGKVTSDQYAIRDSIDQGVANIRDEVFQRIKAAIATPGAVFKSSDPVDKALVELMRSVDQGSIERTIMLHPEIERIDDNVRRIKSRLEDIDRNININSSKESLSTEQHVSDNRKKSPTNPRIKEDKKSMQKRRSRPRQNYEGDMSDIKSQIDNLADIIHDYKALRKKRPKLNQLKHRMSLNRREREETSEGEHSSEAYAPQFKPRSYSQDRNNRRTPKHSVSDFRRWRSVQQNVSSDDALLDEIENELVDLKQQVSSIGSRSSQKFEDAINYISELEREIQARDEELKMRDKRQSRDREKNDLNESLHQTMSEVERCQEDIKGLHRRLNIKSTVTDDLNSNDLDVNKMKPVLQAQKTEIERLSAMLEKLTSHGNLSTTSLSSPQFHQVPAFVASGHASQMFSTPNTAATNSQSTPLLYSGAHYTSSLNGGLGSGNHLFCNVPEHHHLEDYLNVRSGKHSSAKIKNMLKSETHKYMNALDLLQKDLNSKNEELDDVEIQVSKQTGEIERLNYQINELNLAKQDLSHQLSSLRHETDHVTRETIASTSESLGQMRAKKSHLGEEINKLEMSASSRRDEIVHLESELHASRNQLAQVQGDTSDTVRRYEEARCSHRQLLMECEQLEKRSNEASHELARAMHDLNQVQHEVSSLVSSRSNLEGILSKTQEVINQKDEEFLKLNDEVIRTTKILNNLQSDFSMLSEQNREKMHMISDGDQLLSGTRMELNHLKKEIELNQQQLEQMEIELGGKTVALELAKTELERMRQLHQRSSQDYQSEQARLKRDVAELKSTITEYQSQRNDMLNDVEGLKMKCSQNRENIERQEQTMHVHQSEVDRCSLQMTHSENMLKMRQGQLYKLSSEYNERLLDVEKLQAEVHQQEIESKRIDSEIKRKTLEVEKIRQTIAMEHENLQRLQFDKDNLEMGISNLTKERNMLQTQTKELEGDFKNIKKQESQSHESLLSLETRLAQARSEYEKMCSDKCTETIKRDEIKLQTNNMTKQLHESKCELQSMKERLAMLDSQCDERTTEVRKKMQIQNNLNIEIRKLQDQIRMVNMSFEEVNSQEHQRKDRLSGLDVEISRKDVELKNLERQKEDLQNQISKHEMKLEKVLKSSSSELNHLNTELCEKMDNLEATGSRLHQIRKDAAIKEFTEQKILELELIIRQNDSTIEHLEQDNRRLVNNMATFSRDISLLKQSHQFEMENKDKELNKQRKRVSKEMFQLEKLADDQCQRANKLSDDLNQARRDYMLLRNRCLAQEHFIEQQNLFKEYMQPTHLKPDLPKTVETAVLTEHRRHLQNQLNLLRENIESAAHTTSNGLDHHHQHLDGDKKWYTTSSSGLGSTMDHNASDTSPENERIKRSLHNQFNDEIEMMHSENTKSQNMCRQLRSEVNQLKSSLPTDKSTSVSSD